MGTMLRFKSLRSISASLFLTFFIVICSAMPVLADTPGTVSIDNTSPAEGDTLTATVSDADGITDTIDYQWKRAGIDISGAENSTYTTTQADVGSAISVTASYTDDLGTVENLTSALTSAVTHTNVTGTVLIDNTSPAEGDTLTAIVSDADGITDTIDYQWKRAGSDISGAENSTYTTTQADVGSAISVTASYTDDGGTDENLTSDPTSVVTHTNVTGTVSIDNTSPNQGDTITATVTDDDGATGTIGYQWKRGISDI
ncbi:MAG: hypothetical protein KJ737_26895, partial [Proteobacteria bacterium]|nr:hypothetical protein [Pseudomonadota bacterium]